MNITLTVTGMSCGHCVSSIKEGLGKLTGINDVDVSLEKGEVTVATSQSDFDANQLITTLEDLGFDAQVK